MLRNLFLSIFALSLSIPAVSAADGFTFKYNTSKGTCTITGWQGTKPSGKISINNEKTYNGKVYKITAIAQNALNDFPEVTEISIGSNLASIGDVKAAAFQQPDSLCNFNGMPKLEKFTVNASNKYFYASTSSGALCVKYPDGEETKELLRVPPAHKPANGIYIISNTLSNVHAEAFDSNPHITQIKLNNDIYLSYNCGFNTLPNLQGFNLVDKNGYYYLASGTLYHKDSFDGLDELICYPPAKSGSSFTIPANIHIVGQRAFSNTTKLKTINFNNTTNFQPFAFEKCGLTSVTIPATIEFYEGCFRGSKALKKVSITRNGSWTLPMETFRDCTSLSSVTFSSSPKYVESKAFMNCTSLKNFPIDFAKTELDGDSIFANTGFTSVKITKKLGDSYFWSDDAATFSGCRNLEEIDLSGITSSSGKRFHVPFSFATDCPKLKSVIFSPVTDAVPDNAFGNTPAIRKIVITGYFEDTKTENEPKYLFSSNAGGTFAPRVFVIPANPIIKSLTAIHSLVGVTDNTTILAPEFFYQSLEIPTKVPYSVAGGTNYVPAAAASNYESLEGTTQELFTLLPEKDSNGKLKVTCLSMFGDCIVLDLQAKPKGSDTKVRGTGGMYGIYKFDIDYSQVASLYVNYMVDDVAMTTIYPRTLLVSLGTESIQADAASGISVEGRTVTLPAAADYTVYSTTGQTVASGHAASFTLQPGIYLVATAGKTEKVIIP